MRFWQALLLNVAVVAGGLVVYDRVRGDGAEEDPLSDEAMERFEAQFLEYNTRRGGEAQRKGRIAMYIQQMRITSIDRKGERDLVDALDKFQADRLEFFDRVPGTAPDYADKYRAFVQTHMDKVKRIVPDSAQAETVIKRFVFDGRIIRKKPGPADAGPGSPKPGG